MIWLKTETPFHFSTMKKAIEPNDVEMPKQKTICKLKLSWYTVHQEHEAGDHVKSYVS